MWTKSRDIPSEFPGADPATWVAIGDYFEREGARWEEGVTEPGEMPAYFALKVSAAGWHSAALVLVDEEKAERARQNHIVPPPPPPEPTPNPASEHAAGDDRGEGSDADREEEEDHWGGTWEDIDSPWEQLANTFFSILDFLYWLGRWFLGLTARDAAAATAAGGGGDGGVGGSWEIAVGGDRAMNVPDGPARLAEALVGREEERYVWSEKGFPEIRRSDGGMVEVVD